jgi:DNA gyrase/topoisomerase IV subunit A
VDDEHARWLKQARDREHVLTGILKAQDNWEETLRCIAGASDDAEAKRDVAERLGLDDGQATAVLDMQFRRLSQQSRARLTDELASVRVDIERLSAIE